MTLDEAIKESTEFINDKAICLPPSIKEAIALGIEALQELKDMRNNPDFDYTIPLPGETKE